MCNMEAVVKIKPYFLFSQLGNHDNWRLGDRCDWENINGFNVLALSLPGVCVTYYGDELGMVGNFDISYEDSIDTQGEPAGLFYAEFSK